MLYSRFLKSVYLIKLPLFQEEKRKRSRKFVLRNNDRKLIKEPLYNSQWISQQKPCRPEESEMIYSVLKEKYYQPRILYSAKLSFRNEVEIKTFQDKEKLREFIITTPALQEITERSYFLY